jgi:hypothetical protein
MVPQALPSHDPGMTRTEEVQAVLLALQGVAIEEMSRQMPPDDAEAARSRIRSRLMAMVSELRLSPDADARVAAGVMRLLAKLEQRGTNGAAA